MGSEIWVLGGLIWDSSIQDHAESWQIVYLALVGSNCAWSLDYGNEGHFLNQRDGATFQLWVRTKPFNNSYFVEAGFGPYFYFTQPKGWA